MSLTYIIQAHRLPEQLARLVDRILMPGDHAWVHIDARAPLEPFTAARDGRLLAADVTLLERRPTPWARIGLVEVTLDGFARALESGHDFSHLSLLSGQDYPIKPPAAFAAHLAARPRDAFIEYLALPGPRPGDELARLDRRWYWIGEHRFSLPNRWLPLPRTRPLPHGLVPYKGSAFFTLPRDLVAAVLELHAARPQLLRYLRRSFNPDEYFFQTTLVNSAHRDRIVGDNLRLIDFSGGEIHPATLTCADLPRIAGSPKFLARKFDAGVDAAVLDRIDRELLGQTS